MVRLPAPPYPAFSPALCVRQTRKRPLSRPFESEYVVASEGLEPPTKGL
jgi:hypothetical protein